MELRPAGTSRHRGWATAGGAAALLMILGAAGPWVDYTTGTVDGWSGFGVPLGLLAVAALGCQIGHYVRPGRVWMGLTAGIGFFAFTASFLFAFLVWLATDLGGGAVDLVTLGVGGDVTKSMVSAGWGLWLYLVTSVVLTIVAVAALFDRSAEPSVRAMS